MPEHPSLDISTALDRVVQRFAGMVRSIGARHRLSATIYASPNVATGNYTLTLTGTGNGITRTATMVIKVVP